MNLLPMIAINLLCVGVGVGVYDYIKSNEKPDAGQADLMESGDLEDRLAALENRPRANGPLLTGTEAPRLSKGEVIELIREHALKSSTTVVTEGGESVPVKVLDIERIAESPSDSDLAALRKVLDKVDEVRRAEQRVVREKAREERMIANLKKYNLNESQRADLMKIAADHRTNAREIFRKVREGGGGRDEIRAAYETAREDLTKAVENIAPGEDASKISRTLSGFGGGGGNRRAGGGRAR